MKIQGINNINFDAKKFRLPVKFVKNTEAVNMMQSSYNIEECVVGNFVREYNNPKAEEYFYKAMNTSDIDKKFHYLDLMGEYRIIDISLEQQVDKFIKSKLP